MINYTSEPFTDADGDSLTLIGTNVPSWLTFTDNGNGTYTVTGTAPASGGPWTITVNAVDDGFPPMSSTTHLLRIECGIEPPDCSVLPTSLSCDDFPYSLPFVANSILTVTFSGSPSDYQYNPMTGIITDTTSGGGGSEVMNVIAFKDGLTCEVNIPISACVTIPDPPDCSVLPSEVNCEDMPITLPQIPNGSNITWSFANPSTTYDYQPSTGVLSVASGGGGVGNGEDDTLTIFASNAGGQCAHSITINECYVKLSCPNPLELTAGQQVFINIANGNFNSGSISISPTLPNGLSLDSTGSNIIGTPTTVTPNTTYTVTFTPNDGTPVLTCTFEMEVVAPLPDITCIPNQIFTVGVPVSIGAASNVGGSIPAGGWAISPSLPSGLSFDSNTGVISGTPSSISASQIYTVTATNNFGSDSCNFTIEVVSTLPCTGSISCTGDTEVQPPNTWDGVGFVPNNFSPIGSCSGDISGVEIIQSIVRNNGNFTVQLNQAVPSNWTNLNFSDGVNSYNLNLVPHVGNSIFTINVGGSTSLLQNILDGNFTITASC